MKLSKEEVIELKIYLEQKHYERTFKNTKAIKLKNIDNEHICCAIGKKHQCGVDSKKWIKSKLKVDTYLKTKYAYIMEIDTLD